MRARAYPGAYLEASTIDYTQAGNKQAEQVRVSGAWLESSEYCSIVRSLMSSALLRTVGVWGYLALIGLIVALFAARLVQVGF